MNDFGILAFGAYVPRTRLQRKAMAAANGWFNPALRGLAKGERAIGNWDEDAITMGTEAARDCLIGLDRASVSSVVLASTTLPFEDRQNSVVVVNALMLPPSVRTSDTTGGLRCATTALATACADAGAGAGRTLIVGADARKAKAGSTQEMQYGDGAAALLIGAGNPVARLAGGATESVDFVHQYRQSDHPHDYGWEERWIRDEGYLKIVPRAIGAALKAAGVEASAITHFCLPTTLGKVGAAVAKKCGLPETSVRDTLAAVCGETGAAHPLVMLVDALQDARPGERILVTSFGEGCDALVFEVTPAIAKLTPRNGVKGTLARRCEDANYMRYLSFNNLVDLERGMRAEIDKATPLTVLYRNRDMIQGLVGGKCRKCGTVQYPRQHYCVNPACNALNSQDDYGFASLTGKVMSYTADRLTYSPDPPTYFGMVEFDGGGRMMMDFTDVDPAKMDVGLPVKMMFRVKDYDSNRGFRRYFWKAAPANA